MILSAVSTAIFVFDDQHMLLYLNPAARLIASLCQTHAEPGLHLADILPPLADDPEATLSEIGGRYIRWKKSQAIGPTGDKMVILEALELTSETEMLQALDAQLTETLSRQMAAEAQVEGLNEYVGMLSHEIKTPINIVVNTLDFLGETAMTEEQQELFTICQEGAHSLNHSIKRALDLSRSEAEHMGATPGRGEVFDLPSSLTSALAPFRALAKKKELVLDWDLSPSLGQYYEGDWARLRQILVILLDNALKFTPPGGRVKLSAGGGSELLSFVIEDTGPGIPEEAQKEIFQPFRRVATSTEGSGLGLAIAHRLATLMQGTLEVDSVPGQGSRFSLHLCLKVAEEASTPVTVTHSDFSGYRVLAVEDNPVNLTVLRMMLEKMNLDVVTADHPDKALELARQGVFDLVLTDIGLPGMSGVDLVQKLREMPHLEGIPYLAATGSASERDLERYRLVGIALTLEKPFYAPALNEAIRKLLPVR